MNKFSIADGATIHGYSDAHAATVIGISGKTITVQEDTATLLNGPDSGEPDALQVSVGGFCAHVSGTQRYSYTRNVHGVIRKFSLRKDGVYREVGTSRGTRLTVGRNHHFDFNF